VYIDSHFKHFESSSQPGAPFNLKSQRILHFMFKNRVAEEHKKHPKQYCIPKPALYKNANQVATNWCQMGKWFCF